MQWAVLASYRETLADRAGAISHKALRVGERQKSDMDFAPIERIRLPATESCESSKSLTPICPDHIL
jgi:hypothetical protein